MIGFIVLVTVLLLLVVFIPYAVSTYTESEVKDKELREIFWQEAGFRGKRIAGAVGFFWPISLVNYFPQEAEGWVVFMLLFGYCTYEHLKLFKGLKVFEVREASILAALVVFHLALYLLNKYDYIGAFMLFFPICISSLFWGWFINLKRSKLILHNKLRRADPIHSA